jgi:hypothetical protein
MQFSDMEASTQGKPRQVRTRAIERYSRGESVSTIASIDAGREKLQVQVDGRTIEQYPHPMRWAPRDGGESYSSRPCGLLP